MWSNGGLSGELAKVLPSPRHFEQASQLVTEQSTRDSVVAGPDPEAHLAQVDSHREAGYDELYVANMGPHYLHMIEFCGKEILPALG